MIAANRRLDEATRVAGRSIELILAEGDGDERADGVAPGLARCGASRNGLRARVSEMPFDGGTDHGPQLVLVHSTHSS